MAGKVVLINGATGGIDKATASALPPSAPGSAEVAISRGKQAASGNPAVDAFAADVTFQVEVRQLTIAVLETYPGSAPRCRTR